LPAKKQRRGEKLAVTDLYFKKIKDQRMGTRGKEGEEERGCIHLRKGK